MIEYTHMIIKSSGKTLEMDVPKAYLFLTKDLGMGKEFTDFLKILPYIDDGLLKDRGVYEEADDFQTKQNKKLALIIETMTMKTTGHPIEN